MPTDSHEDVIIRPATTEDAEAVARIYNYYIRETVVTFEEVPLSTGEILQRILDVQSASFPWLVAECDGRVVGYAYANKWNSRSAYRFSVELTVYLDHEYGGKGIGSGLYSTIFAILEGRGFHAFMGGISLPNEASVALHEKLGFQKVAHFKEVGFKFDRWIDVGYWERIL